MEKKKKEKERKEEDEKLAWVLMHPVIRGPNGERIEADPNEPPTPRPPREL